MSTLRWVVFASGAVSSVVGVAYLAACSSDDSSAPVVPSSEGGGDGASAAETSFYADAHIADGGQLLKLTWSVVVTDPPGEGQSADAAAAEGGGSEAGSSDSGAADGSTDSGAVATGDATAGSTGGDGGQQGSPPLAGVQVCVYQNSAIPCQTTDQNGEFTLTGLTARTDIVITLNKTGYVPQLLAVETASIDMDGRQNPIFMSSNAPDPNLPVTVDWTNKGQVSIFALTQTPSDGGAGGFVGDPGTSLTLTPMSGDGPFYTNNRNQFVPGATSFVDIIGWYYNLAPGMYTLTFNDAVNDCEPISFQFGGWGFPVTTPKHSLQFPIVAGYATGIVGELCTPISVTVDAGH